MSYFEYEQEFIDELRYEIGPDHPLYRKRLYVTARRRDPTAVIFETIAKKSNYALVYLTCSGKRGKRNPKTRIIATQEDLQAFIQKEHDDWIEECDHHPMRPPLPCLAAIRIAPDPGYASGTSL